MLEEICPVTFWSLQVLTLPGAKKKKEGREINPICELVFIGAFSPSCLPSIIFTVKNFLKNVKYNVFTATI